MCNMAFVSDVVPENWRIVVTVPLIKGKRESTECKSREALVC